MKHLYALVALYLFTLTISFAQNRVITGTVTDINGQILPGVTVRIQNAPLGTSVSTDGSYQLEVPPKYNTLTFSFLGYQQQEINIEGRLVINIQLKENASYLDEVVVVGFGSQSKRRLTSSIVSVSEEVFNNNPSSDIQNALQGQMSGVVLSNSSGFANSDASIRIRGVGSISAGNQPIIVIDGLVLSGRINNPAYDYGGAYTNPFISLNPNDIASVEVLKDAAASAIYGSRGANGVILITTKSGQYNSAPKVHIGYWAGFSEASKTHKLLNGKEWAESWNQAALNAGYTPQDDPDIWYDPDTQPSTDWQDLLLRKGFEQEMNTSVSGGTKTTKYLISGTVRDEDGYLKNSGFKRYAVRANIDQIIGDKVTVGMSIAPTRVKTKRPNNYDSPFYSSIYAQPNVDAFDVNGSSIGFPDIYSPYVELLDVWSDLTTSQVLLNTYINYNLLQNLTLKTSFSTESTQREELFKYGSKTYLGFPVGSGTAFNQETFNYNWTALAIWNKTFAIKHELDITAGFNVTKETLRSKYLEGTSYADDRLLHIGAAAIIQTNISNHTEAGFTGLLARANYAYANKYLLSLSARYDGSSRFGTENRYGFFPAISAGWIISDEKLFKPAFVSFLKLRTSFGVAGNAEIGDFASRGLVRFGQNYNGAPGYDIRNIENKQLGWERNVQWDAGLEFALFKNRIRGSLGYYIKDSKDLLLEVPIPATNGFTVLSQNIGSVRNQGFEFELSADLLKGPFQWTIQANGATLKNEVLRLIDTDGDGLDDEIYSEFRFLFRPGLSIGTFYLVEYAGVDPENGDALFWNADKTEKLANSTQDANRRIVGKSIPDFTGGFNNTFRYKNFELSTFFQFKTGFQIYRLNGSAMGGVNGYSNSIKKYADNVWTPDNRNTNIPQNRLFEQNGAQRTSRNLYDGDYLRLKNISLGYTFPAFGARNNRLYVFVSGQNLWILTNYPGLDPDAEFFSPGQAEQGAILGSPPSKRTYSMGFNLDF